MKHFILALILLGSGVFTIVRADAAAPTTYTGHVDGLKDLQNGALLVNLDGVFPSQKMTLYISSEAKLKFPRLPVVGETVTATGTQVDFKGKPEIKLSDPSQLTWADPAPGAAPAPGSP